MEGGDREGTLGKLGWTYKFKRAGFELLRPDWWVRGTPKAKVTDSNGSALPAMGTLI